MLTIESFQTPPEEAARNMVVAEFAHSQIYGMVAASESGVFVEDIYPVVRAATQEHFDEDLYTWEMFASDMYWISRPARVERALGGTSLSHVQ